MIRPKPRNSCVPWSPRRSIPNKVCGWLPQKQPHQLLGVSSNPNVYLGAQWWAHPLHPRAYWSLSSCQCVCFSLTKTVGAGAALDLSFPNLTAAPMDSASAWEPLGRTRFELLRAAGDEKSKKKDIGWRQGRVRLETEMHQDHTSRWLTRRSFCLSSILKVEASATWPPDPTDKCNDKADKNEVQSSVCKRQRETDQTHRYNHLHPHLSLIFSEINGFHLQLDPFVPPKASCLHLWDAKDRQDTSLMCVGGWG